MIVSFSISNFTSFSTEETFSLVASNRFSGSHDEHTVPIPDSREKVLRAAVVYGANGAGKSNLFKAVRFVESIALTTRKKSSRIARTPFRFGELDNQASTFDLQFIAAEKLYRFGFRVDDDRIIEEWLFQVVGNRQKPIYERTTDANGTVTIDSTGLKDASNKVRALATVAGPPNQSFLATLNATLDEEDIGEELGSVLHWFKDDLTLIAPDAPFGSLANLMENEPSFLSFANEFLKSASTGVDHLEVLKRAIPRDELSRLYPDFPLSSIMRDLANDGELAVVLRLGEGRELLVEGKGENRFYLMNIEAAHEPSPGKVVRLQLAEESDGTRRLLNLIPALHHLQTTSATYFIDEIDRSLHPILVKEFLSFFLKTCHGGPRQVIVTTHESNLLDQDLLRRDEIWFAEKDQDGATRLYSLSDFKVRNDLEIRKHYLQGRFGAVPFLGNLDDLAAKAEQPE